jgi:hypothetical protein
MQVSNTGNRNLERACVLLSSTALAVLLIHDLKLILGGSSWKVSSIGQNIDGYGARLAVRCLTLTPLYLIGTFVIAKQLDALISTTSGIELNSTDILTGAASKTSNLFKKFA